ncbi:MAG TPA: glycerophosphodiester phosphodiesterase [Dehalococcoidia bacterium]
MQAPTIIAHRTCPRDEPENSIAGIRKAAELGADGVEIDLRMSLDQKPFLMHDDTMKRMTGWGRPLEATFAATVRQQHLPNSEPVPSLSDVFDALPEGQQLAVDVKTPWAVVPLVAEIKRRAVESRVLIWCTSSLACRYAAHKLPSVEVAYLKTALDPASQRRFLDTAVSTGARAVSTHWRAVTKEHVADAHSRGLRIFSWHDEYELSREKLEAGLDILITDYPVRAREAYAAL